MFTEEQQKAIDWQTGPLLLNAGAGAGKTAVLIERYKRLVSSGVNPRKILAITFTNKAANEMKERVLRHLPDIKKKDMHIFTFHGLCNYWLRYKGSEINMNGYSIVNADDAESMLWSVVKHIPTNPKFGQSQLEYENKKNKSLKLGLVQKVLNILDTYYGLTIEKAVEMSGVKPPEYCIKVLTKYKKLLSDRKLLTFSDLHNVGITLFKSCDYIAKTYEYFMVKLIDPLRSNAY